MMAARETMRGREDSTIGGVGISVHMNHLHMGLPKNLAPVAAKPSAKMTGSGAVVELIAPAAVSSGARNGTGEDSTRMEIYRCIVKSGVQPPAPMASPSH